MIDPSRFWKHCMLLDDSPNSCWIWTGAFTDGGMGRYFSGGRIEIRANRAAYELRFGEPVPPGRILRKDCAHPQCVRHWVLGGMARKLEPEDVTLIRGRTLSLSMLAKRLGITRNWANMIRMGIGHPRRT